MHVSQIFYYPVKGARGVEVSEAIVYPTGIEGDRRWVIVDESARFVTQREVPALCQLGASLENQKLILTYNQQKVLIDRAPGDFEKKQIQVWNDRIIAYDCGDAPATFISNVLQKKVRLYEAFETRKIARIDIPEENGNYLFADSYPFLVISQESLDDLKTRLDGYFPKPITINRFRPNLVISGWTPYGEDRVSTIQIGQEILLKFGKLCSRCNVINIDPSTAQIDSEPLKSLSSYRKLYGSKIYFGTNMWLSSKPGSTIKVGDPVTVID